MTRLFKIHFILALLLSVQTSMSKEIGVASAVNKNTTDLTLEEERKLVEAGYKIIQNHTLETDAIGRAALLLIDGTSFSIGPNSSVTLDKFIYNPETAEGSLEVSSRGLLRLVGGKVTKKRPALIRTNSATVGIRGGITIVQTQGLSTSAAFVYGEELTMTPNQNSAAATSLIENGFVVTVEDPTDEVSEPQQLSETFLAELQKGLEARENDEESSEEESSEEESSEEESSEEESSEEESSEEESSEEESTEESKEEESTEESTQEESSEESSEETTSEESASEEQSESTTEETNTSEDQGQDNDTQQESASVTETESGSDNSAAQDDSTSDSSVENQISDQADTSAGVDNDPQPDVDESALDSSGVSDNSSDIAPSELSTADDVVDTAVDVDTTSEEVEETTEETEEASETSIEDTAAVETTETVVEEAPFDASLSNASIQINENETDINLATLQTNKDDDVEVTVTIDGEDKDLFQYDPSTNSLSFIGEANYEDQTNFSLNLIVQREDEEVVIPVNISVRDINEAPSVSTEIQDSYAEDLATGSVLVGVTISDPENQEVTYSISGEGSDKFTIDEAGNITLAESFDFETKASYTLTVIATDGELSSETEVFINVGDINEAPSLSSALSSTSFSEDSALGTIIATSSVADPESNTITYSLTGPGSEYFSVDENGNVTLKDSLDFETYSNYEITLVASDGELTTSSVITFDISDVDEAPSLSSTLKSESFEESIAVGTALATISSVDPESQTITYSLSGTGSENFEIDSKGNITSKVTFDYETETSYTFNVTASDGTNSTTSPLTITLSDVNESPDVTISLQGSEFAENITTGSTIATIAYTDPESDELTYTLSGTGSDQFSIDDQGVITLKTGLDYETKTSYELTLTSSDGTNSVQTQINFSVTDISELALSLDNTEVTLAENISTGSSIAQASSSDAAGEVTYSISEGGVASDIFSIDSQGRISLKSSLDYETKTSYELEIVASDGKETVSKPLTITISDVDLSVTSSLASASQAETISTGTSILTLSTSNAEGTLSYSITDADDKFAINSSTGEVTLANALDYETKTSHSFTVTVTDGVTTSSETFTLNVTDIDLTLSSSLASSSQLETISTGTTIVTSSTSNSEGTVSYSLTDDDNKFSIDSSTGEVTLSNALDYETKTSHSFTVTATDGVTTTSQVFTLTVDNAAINTLAVTLANSGAALAESSSSGTSVGSSSITNPESETVSYSLSGTGSSNFAVDSSGNITTNAALDYETAKSYSLTLTATAGGTTTTDAFTVNVKNVEELESAVLRYSAAYNSVSRSGFSATATRGPSGSSLPAYTLEQVGTTNSTDITSVDDTSLNYVPVEINSGTVLNWRYYFPIDTSGNGEFSFAPNSSARDGKYYSTQGTAVTTTIDNAEFLTAGRLEGAKYWFMTTDKSASNINYTSSTATPNALILTGGTAGSWANDLETGTRSWPAAINELGGTYTHSTNPSSVANMNQYTHVIDIRLGNVNNTLNSSIVDFVANGGIYKSMWYEWNGCCSSSYNRDRINEILEDLGYGSNTYVVSGSYENNSAVTISNPNISGTSFNYDALPSSIGFPGTYHKGIGSSIASGCNLLTPGVTGLMICDPAAKSNSQTHTGTIVGTTDINWQNQGLGSYSTANGYLVMKWILELGLAQNTSTYNLYEDQVTIAGEVYTDALFKTHTDSQATNKRVYGFLVIPIENFAASGTSNDYFIPNFIPKTLWSYGDVGHDYCLGMASNSASDCNTYENYYDFSSIALSEAVNAGTKRIDTSRFTGGSANDFPEGQSMWWQVLDTSGTFNKGVGLWAQISIKDSYDGASGSTTRDDQESLLNVVISSIDDRKNDTTRYSVGDTGLGMDGYHYWSYQGATNADNDGLGINYGTSPIECATSMDTGCFWGTDSGQTFRGAMITSSDPYKSGDMTLSVNYNSNNDTFSTGTFNQSIVQVDAKGSASGNYLTSLQASNFRMFNDATNYSGFLSGILEFDVSGTGNSQLSSIRSSSTLASFTFDFTNDDVQVVAPMTVSAAPSNNYTSNWSTVDTGSMTLKFGDATNDEAKSAFISHEVFGAEIQDDGAQIDGTSGGSNNLAGVMVSYNTLEKEDSDLFHTGGNDSMPDTRYSSWGFWAMSAADISPNSGDQNASVHLGTWVGGELLDQNDIPTSGSASMSGAAAVNVAYRYNQTGTNYDVHKYTTTADVAASFSWGASGYSGTLDFTNFDDKNPIVANAGFASFSVAITGTNNTYTGTSTDSLDNSWLGGAAVAGALFGDSSQKESGGRVNVNLYKSGDTGTAGANDFYMAEGIYLLCENGGC
ncbi:cadherin domain-containing protein [SAR86 cluster bacterium]|nr:cadherin domain-containing protein [SAR86 cluster bacterium]